MEKEKKDIFDKIWDFLASVKLTVVVLITLALTSIIGTLIEQQAPPAKTIELFSRLFGDSTAPTIYNIFVKLDFMDLYHSWWFIGLLALFNLNLIVCTLERFPKTLRFVKTPLRPLKENVIRALPVKKELKVKSDFKTAKDEVLNSLNTSGYRAFEATEENSVQLYSQKGRYSRFGLYIVHLSVFLIFVGAVISAHFAINGNFILPEGEGTSLVTVRTGPLTPEEESDRDQIIYYLELFQGDVSLLSERRGIDEDVLNAKMEKYGIIPLGFTIVCKWFNVTYHEQSPSIDDFIKPLRYESELVIIDGGKEVKRKVIWVNNPLKYKGIYFYQSSFGMLPNAKGEFVLKVTPYGGQESTLRLKPGGTFEIAGTDIKGTIIDFSPALFYDDSTKKFFTPERFKEQMVHPAVNIEFVEPGKKTFSRWIYKRFPDSPQTILQSGHKIKFVDYWGVEYTGLQFAKDPGVVVIYFASGIMFVGLLIAFFMSHKKIWVSLTPDTSGKRDSVRISIGGSASKNRFSFEKEIEKILSRASQAIEERSKK